MQNDQTQNVDELHSQRAPQRALRPVMFYLIVALVFFSDQISKAWIKDALPRRPNGEMPIIGDAFLLSLTHNHGGAWGVLPQGNYLFVVFAAFAIVALIIAYHRMQRIELLVGTAFALALGGAAGNLLDRLRYGSVVDFFYVKIINFPIFNVADSAITVGILLLFFHFLRTAREEDKMEADKREEDKTKAAKAETYSAEAAPAKLTE